MTHLGALLVDLMLKKLDLCQSCVHALLEDLKSV